MIKKITLSVLAIIAIVLLFAAAFFSFAPEDRIHSFKIWTKSILGDPIARCIQHHRDDFFVPNSLRYVDTYPGDSIKDSTFAIRVSAITQGGGRGYQYIDCIGERYADYTNFTPPALNQILRELKEENARLDREIKEQKLERKRKELSY